MKYFIIHNLDPKRKKNMTTLCKNNEIDMSDVIWVDHLNELSPKLKKEILVPNCNRTKGIIACTYKHYLALKHIVENNYAISVIMEDNIGKADNIIPHQLEKYIQQLPENWDVIFDGGIYLKYTDGLITPDKLVYLKSNVPSHNCGGGTKCAQFYMLTLECAKKLLDNYLPYNDAPDWHMNKLFLRLGVQSYWAIPSNIHTEENHVSTCN